MANAKRWIIIILTVLFVPIVSAGWVYPDCIEFPLNSSGTILNMTLCYNYLVGDWNVSGDFNVEGDLFVNEGVFGMMVGGGDPTIGGDGDDGYVTDQFEVGGDTFLQDDVEFNTSISSGTLFINESFINLTGNIEQIGDTSIDGLVNVTINLTVGGYIEGQPIKGHLDSGLVFSNNLTTAYSLNISHDHIGSPGTIGYGGGVYLVRNLIDSSPLYCNISAGSLTPGDNQTSIYYIDENCLVQNTSWTGYQNSFRYLPWFLALMKHSGDIEFHYTTTLMNKQHSKDDIIKYNFDSLRILQGFTLFQEGDFPNITIESGQYQFVRDVLLTTEQNTSDDKELEVVAYSGGSPKFYELNGLNLTHCDDGTEAVPCTTSSLYRRTLIGITGNIIDGDDTSEIHQILPLQTEVFTNIGNCINVVDSPIGDSFTLPSYYNGVFINLYMYCYKPNAAGWTGSMLDLRDTQGVGGGGGSVDTSQFVLRDGTSPMTGNWEYGGFDLINLGFTNSSEDIEGLNLVSRNNHNATNCLYVNSSQFSICGNKINSTENITSTAPIFIQYQGIAQKIINQYNSPLLVYSTEATGVYPRDAPYANIGGNSIVDDSKFVMSRRAPQFGGPWAEWFSKDNSGDWTNSWIFNVPDATGYLRMYQTGTFTDNAIQIEGDLRVIGDTTINDNLELSSYTTPGFLLSAVTGLVDSTYNVPFYTEFDENVTIVGNLTVNGSAWIKGGLNVTGNAVFNGSVNISANTNILGHLNVSSANIGNLSISEVTTVFAPGLLNREIKFDGKAEIYNFTTNLVNVANWFAFIASGGPLVIDTNFTAILFNKDLDLNSGLCSGVTGFQKWCFISTTEILANSATQRVNMTFSDVYGDSFITKNEMNSSDIYTGNITATGNMTFQDSLCDVNDNCIQDINSLIRVNDSMNGYLSINGSLNVYGEPSYFNATATEYIVINQDSSADTEILFVVDGGGDYMNLCMDDTDDTFKMSDSINCETNPRLTISPTGTVDIVGALTSGTYVSDGTITAGTVVYGAYTPSPTMTVKAINADAYAIWGENQCTGTNCLKMECDGSILEIQTLLTQTCGIGICSATDIEVYKDAGTLAKLTTTTSTVTNTEYSVEFTPNAYTFGDGETLSIYVDLGTSITGVTASSRFTYECSR